MDEYSFGMPDKIKEILDALAKQNQQPQEPPTGTQYADAKFQAGNEAANAAYNQQQAQAQQQQLQPFSPVQYQLGNQMLESKNAYENALAAVRALNPNVTDENQLNALADQVRTDSHKRADNIRELASKLGVDLSGIEDVGYEDASKNMLARKTKEIADIMSGMGKYGRTSEQYFNDEYLRLGMEGKSARNAKRLAGQAAQRYQAERVTYLRNAFNMYGRDGNYINDNGVPILQSIATEMPEIAQVYWQAYKNPAQAQDRTETLEDKALDQTDAIAKILETFKGHSQLQAEQNELNITRDNNLSANSKDEATHQNALDIERLTRVADIQFGKWKEQNKIEREDDEGKFTRELNGIFRGAYSFAIGQGASEENANLFAGQQTMRYLVNEVNKNQKSSANSSGSKPTEPKYTEKQNTFMRNMENLITQAKADPTNTELIDQIEALFKGGDGNGIDEDKSAVKALDFPVATYQLWEDEINALRGMTYKVKGDDNGATAYWVRVKDVNVLEEMYPKYNWDWYWKRRGGKPK